VEADDLVHRDLPGLEPVANLREQLPHRLVELRRLRLSHLAVLRDLVPRPPRLLEGATQLGLSGLHQQARHLLGVARILPARPSFTPPLDRKPFSGLV
jgi:hypothetical protein